MLKNSERNSRLTRSVTCVRLIREKSRFLKAGPHRLFRPASPKILPFAFAALGRMKILGSNHWLTLPVTALQGFTPGLTSGRSAGNDALVSELLKPSTGVKGTPDINEAIMPRRHPPTTFAVNPRSSCHQR